MKKQNYTEIAYSYIKEKIIRGELKAGEVLSISALAETLNISRTPVNNACQRLEAEKLLTIVPKQGIVVKSASIDDFRHLYEMRAAIETYAAKLAFNHINDTDIATLKAILAAQQKALSPVDEYAFMIEDMKFHHFLVSKSGNPRFIDILDNLNDQALIAGIKNSASHKRIHQAFEEHQKIIDALVQKDKVKFIHAIEENIISGFTSLTSMPG